MVRVVHKAKYRSHSEPLFKNLGLIKLEDMYTLSAMKFYFKYLNEKLPQYFTNMFKKELTTHSYNTRNRDAEIPNNPKHRLLQSSIRYSIPETLKIMPVCIIDKLTTHSLNGLSTYMKKHILNTYSELCTIADCYTCSNQ